MGINVSALFKADEIPYKGDLLGLNFSRLLNNKSIKLHEAYKSQNKYCKIQA
jgi:hypothetical protein